jgi:YVTN family beta-propeller protein
VALAADAREPGAPQRADPTAPARRRAAPAGPIDVYAFIGPEHLDPALAGLAPLVYVPNEHGSSVTVIDAETFEVVRTMRVGEFPHHITPSWSMRRLFVSDMFSDALTIIDPFRTRKVGRRPVPAPYNLYFTPDGEKALVIAEPLDRIEWYDLDGWTHLKRLRMPTDGVDHGDFSANGGFFMVTTEHDGWLHRISVRTMRIRRSLYLGGQPIDVKLSADGSVFYVANQQRDGVSIVDPVAMEEIGFLPTGDGAHGLAVSRDGDALYVANRRAGTIGVIDFATRSIRDTWDVDGSPDMLNVSIDGTQLWASNRSHDDVTVIDTSTGEVIERIPTGEAPHGLTYFPQPGRFSIGHNGVYR